MSSVIAYRDVDGTVFLAGDRFVGSASFKHTINEPKVFKVGSVYFGVIGSVADVHAMKYLVEMPERLEGLDEMEYLVKLVLPAIRKAMSGIGRLHKENEIIEAKSWIMVVLGGRIFTLQDDLSLVEIEGNFECMGYNLGIEYGAMFILDKTDLSAREKILKTYEAEVNIGQNVSPPIDLINTKTGEVEKIESLDTGVRLGKI